MTLAFIVLQMCFVMWNIHEHIGGTLSHTVRHWNFEQYLEFENWSQLELTSKEKLPH